MSQISTNAHKTSMEILMKRVTHHTAHVRTYQMARALPAIVSMTGFLTLMVEDAQVRPHHLIKNFHQNVLC